MVVVVVTTPVLVVVGMDGVVLVMLVVEEVGKRSVVSPGGIVVVIVATTDSISCSEAKVHVVLVGIIHAIFCIYFQSGTSGRKLGIGSSRKRNRIGSGVAWDSTPPLKWSGGSINRSFGPQYAIRNDPP